MAASSGTLATPNARPDRPRPRYRGAPRRDLRRRARRAPPRRVDRGQERPASRASRWARRDGFGVRVLVDGAWGFAASDTLDLAEADRVGALAVRIAKASATALRNRVVLDGRPPANGTFETPGGRGPVQDPARGARSATSSPPIALAGAVKGVTFTESMYAGASRVEDVRRDRRQLHRAGDHPGRQRRRGERDRGRRAPAPELSGLGRRLPGRPATSTSAGSTSRATPDPSARRPSRCSPRRSCPPGRRTIVLDPSMLYLQIHESCGHPTELDRVFGTEASYAGTSFLTPDKLDEGFMYGSELVTIVADATAAGGLGTFGWDDEGVAAQSVPLIQNGRFVGYQSSRETAPRIGRRVRRRDARRRLEPDPAHPDDQRQHAARAGHEPRRDRRRHGRRPVPREQPQLVDRRPAPQLPVRDRGRLRDQGRQEGPAVQERHVHRHHVRVLALVRRGRRRAQLRDARDAELRQGRAVADGAGRPCACRAPASATSRWGSASGERRLRRRRERRHADAARR